MNRDVFVVIEHIQGQVSDISYVMLAAARDLTTTIGGKVIAILLGHNATNLAANLDADVILYGDHPALEEFTSDGYIKALSKLIEDEQPRSILFGSTTIGSDVAGSLGAKFSFPVISSCISFQDGNTISKICGGKIMAESQLVDNTTIITMIPGGYKPEEGHSETAPPISVFDVDLVDQRVLLKQYIEPEETDVDITQEAVLVGVGRGIQTEDNIELVEELAELLGGTICASRPIVDQGWLPVSRLVGKSGKHVKPKLYLSIGISGAPEHAEGMSEAEMIVAINNDPAAPIFNIAKYGAVVDLFDLIDFLIEAIEAAD